MFFALLVWGFVVKVLVILFVIFFFSASPAQSPTTVKSISLIVVFVTTAVSDLYNVENWTRESDIHSVYWEHPGEVVVAEVTVMEGQMLSEILKSKVLGEVNESQKANNFPEVLLSGQNLYFLSHLKWTDMSYQHLIMLKPSNAKQPLFKGKSFVVIRSDNQCKFFY